MYWIRSISFPFFSPICTSTTITEAYYHGWGGELLARFRIDLETLLNIYTIQSATRIQIQCRNVLLGMFRRSDEGAFQIRR